MISKAGYIVGMVTQFNVSGESSGPSGDSGSSSKNDSEIDRFPFYMAMQGESLFKGIKEIDSDVCPSVISIQNGNGRYSVKL